MYDIASREREVVENDKYYFLEIVKKEEILNGGLVKGVLTKANEINIAN